MGWKRARVMAAGIAAVGLAGCSAQEAEDSPPEAEDGADSAEESPAEASADAGDQEYEDVELESPDGEVREGRVFGDGTQGVVLSHMGRPTDGQDDWEEFAAALAERGYLVLTYEGRGDLGAGWQDVLGAEDHVRELGAENVIAAGASIGAMDSLHAAGQDDAEFNGVIWLAGVLAGQGYDFQEDYVSGLDCPMLFASSDRDPYGAAQDTEELHEWAGGSSELTLVEGRSHGTDLFEDEAPNPEDLRDLMFDWIDEVAESEPEPC